MSVSQVLSLLFPSPVTLRERSIWYKVIAGFARTLLRPCGELLLFTLDLAFHVEQPAPPARCDPQRLGDFHLVEKRGKDRWRARYRGPDRRERSKTFARKVDAERFLTTIEGAKLRGEWVDPGLGRTTYRAWVNEWWATTKNLRPSTKARDEAYLRGYVLPQFEDLPLAAIGQLDVRSWVAELSSRGLAPATVQKAYQILGKTLRAAVDAGLISRSPCRAIPLPRIEREEMRFLSPQEIAALSDVIHPRYRALVLVGAYGGLRLGELAGLRPERVNILHGRVDVAEVLLEVNGEVHYGPPKTRAGRRAVSLPRGVVDELAAHLASWSSPERVFTAPEGGPLRAGTFRRRMWRPATAAAGVDGLRPHDLRHTAVALWIAAGANPKEVAARAGHTSVAFALDRYGHLFPEADGLLRGRLDDMFKAAEPAAGGDLLAFPE